MRTVLALSLVSSFALAGPVERGIAALPEDLKPRVTEEWKRPARAREFWSWYQCSVCQPLVDSGDKAARNCSRFVVNALKDVGGAALGCTQPEVVRVGPCVLMAPSPEPWCRLMQLVSTSAPRRESWTAPRPRR
jgi:hypothetical protein